MRILSVQMRGFGPFKDAQLVDFTEFDDSGIFLIGGRTGAGKSTILDAICFALYGSVPRYDGYSGVMRLRSDHCEVDDVTEVTLTFEVDGETYRIARSPEYSRPKSRGDGVTRQAATVELSIGTDRGWEALETKIPEVARRVAEIVQLDKGQFLQVILLAQNRFQEFLDAESRDRQSLLRTLFGTERFERYTEALNARAQELGSELMTLTRDAERTVTDLAAELGVEPPWESDAPLLWAQERVTAAEAALEAARIAELHAVKEAKVASDELAAVRELAARQQRQREAAERLAELQNRVDGYERTKRQVEAAQRAAAVRPRAEEADASARALDRARADATAALELAGAVPAGDLSDFSAGIGRTIGALAQALEIERTLPELEHADADAREAAAAHEESTLSLDARRAALRQRLSELTQSESAAAIAAGDLGTALAMIASTEGALAAAIRLSEIELEISRLEIAELAATRARTNASQTVDRLLTTQLRGRAALLAQSLVDGEACAVCGALDHPRPARFDGDPITDAQVSEARDAFRQLSAAADSASRALSSAQANAAEQRGIAAGRTPAELRTELDAGHARWLLAQAATEKLAVIAGEKRELAEQQQRLDEEEQGVGARRTRLLQDAAVSARALADAQALVARSRDSHRSVAARVSDLTRKQQAVERLATAQRSVSAAQATNAAANANLVAQLAQSGFADRSAAEQAMLAPERLGALADAVRAYEDEMTETTAVLDQPDLQNLPGAPADVIGASERASVTDAARGSLTERRVTLDGRAKRAHALTEKLATELERSASIAADFSVIDTLARATRGEAPNQLGIPLESFVLAAELEEIVDAANGRLRTMSQGRYAIQHSDVRTRGGKRTGLEIVVYDAHTGATRSPRSLSGGEKFLASLALALGLAEVVTSRAGGIQLETLFIDEGFGALDNETLELVMHTLDELRQGGRTVGLISHVEAMKDQIPAKLLVGVADGGWSVIDHAA